MWKRDTMVKGTKKDRVEEPTTYEATLHLHKRLHGVSKYKRAPRAIKEVRQFAAKQMRTEDVRLDNSLNHQVWSKGVNTVPVRIRVRMEKKRNENEDAEHKFYTLVSNVHVTSFSGLQHQKVE